MFKNIRDEIRGGTRGGKDQFSWNDVKEDKHRVMYLGNSVKAPVGRWQKNKDILWFERETKQAQSYNKAEIKRIKQAEEEAMAEALGYKPASRVEQVNEDELKRAIEKSKKKLDEESVNKGIGFYEKSETVNKSDFVTFEQNEPKHDKPETPTNDLKRHKKNKEEKKKGKKKSKKEKKNKY